MTTVESHDRITYGSSLSRGASEKAGKGIPVAGIAGFVVAILSILGLINVGPICLAAVAAILTGLAVLWEGVVSGADEETAQVGQTGFSAAIIGGIAAVVLGVLALLGLNSEVLLPVVVLILGAVYFLAGRGGLISGGHFLVGTASMVLGILAVAGSAPMTLTLTALLCLGCGTTLNCPTFASSFRSWRFTNSQ
jgi:hypothetical protein